MDIMFPSLPVSILYSHVHVLRLLILCYGIENLWSYLLWSYQTPLLPPLFPQHFGAFNGLLCAFLCCHLLTAFCSGFYTPAQNNLLCHTLHSSCHRLESCVVHVCCQSIYSCFVSPFYFICVVCDIVLLVMFLWHQTLCFLLSWHSIALTHWRFNWSFGRG